MNEEALTNGEHFTVVGWKKSADRSYIGSLFKTLSTDGSLIHCKRLTGGLSTTNLMVLDRNLVDIRKVNSKFATRVINDCECCCKCDCCGD